MRTLAGRSTTPEALERLRPFHASLRFSILTCCLAGSGTLLAQAPRQVLNMAYPAAGTIARLHVDLRGNPHGGWPTVLGDVDADGHDDFFWARWSLEEDTWPDSLLVFGGPHLVGKTERPITEAPHLRIHTSRAAGSPHAPLLAERRSRGRRRWRWLR
jgi:hypothetical protein